jgi:DNA polymerase-1
LDIETTELNPWRGEILSIGFGFKDSQWILPLQHRESPYKDNHDGQVTLLRILLPHLVGKSIIMHNGKFDSLWIKVKYGLTIPITHDTMMMSHLLDENDKHGLKYLAQVVFGAENYDLSVEAKTGDAPLEMLAKYNAFDVYYTRALYNEYIEQLKLDPVLYKFYKKVIMPAVNAFRDIEYNGVYIDKDKLLGTKLQLESEVAGYLKELNRYKEGVNWNSSQQLSQFLFGDLGLNPLDKTPKGANSTSESVLKRLNHPAVEIILKYREAYKFLGTFITSWMEKEMGSRLHPTFKLHGTVTGRLSCEDPNLQQVPRDPKIRSLVTAPPGYTFVEADFSQVELRIAAMLSGDPIMRESFLTGVDVHTRTAQAISGKDLSTMEGFDAKEWRKKAKAINFGFLYGMGTKKFAEYARDKYQVNFTVEESKKIRDKFFATYVGLQPWYRRMERIAKADGQVRSLSGRIRHLPTINSPDEFEQSQAVRQAINSPVQGFASDLTLMAVVDIVKSLSWVKVVGTVHDSIIMEVPNDTVELTIKRVKEIMEHPPVLDELGIKLSLPIKVDIKTGSWGS